MLINDNFACFKILRLFIITYLTSKLIHAMLRDVCRMYISTFTLQTIGGHSYLTCKYYCLQSAPILTAAVFRQRHIYGYFLVLFSPTLSHIFTHRAIVPILQLQEKENLKFFLKVFLLVGYSGSPESLQRVYWWAQQL